MALGLGSTSKATALPRKIQVPWFGVGSLAISDSIFPFSLLPPFPIHILTPHNQCTTIAGLSMTTGLYRCCSHSRMFFLLYHPNILKRLTQMSYLLEWKINWILSFISLNFINLVVFVVILYHFCWAEIGMSHKYETCMVNCYQSPQIPMN